MRDFQKYSKGKKRRIEIALREEARKEAEREEEARREVERSAQEATIDEAATTLLESSSGNNTNDSGAVEHLTNEVGVQTELSLKDVKYMEERENCHFHNQSSFLTLLHCSNTIFVS